MVFFKKYLKDHIKKPNFARTYFRKYLKIEEFRENLISRMESKDIFNFRDFP